jgi:flagellar hook assembly protein FlgD
VTAWIGLDSAVRPEERVSMGIYDVRGRLVRSFPLLRVSGAARLIWDGRDDAGRSVASGRYWARARRAWPFFESSTPITWLR